MKLSSLVLASVLFAAPAFAESRRIVCEFSDNIFRYRDVFILEDNGQASVESTVGSSDIGENSYGCAAHDVPYSEENGIVRFKAQVRCVDGTEGDYNKTLDLKRMMLDGGWQGSVPCRAER